MHPSLPQTAPILPALWQQDRIARLTALTPEDARAGLLWLAMNHPDTCDAMLDKIECDAIDDPDPGREPEPFCAECGADIGIFLRRPGLAAFQRRRHGHRPDRPAGRHR